MNDFLSLCRRRRSIRRYTAEQVSESDLEIILQCALMSPSGKRINPWECIVIRDKKMLLQFATVKKFGSAMFATAPVGIVIVMDPTLSDTWQCDGAIMAHNITLCATDLGLGACWCHIYGREHDTAEQSISASAYVKELLGIPQNKEVLCIISIGHVDEERKQYDLAKLPYEKIHKEHY